MTPEGIYAALAGRNHGGVTLSDIQKTRVAEFMGGRPMGSVGAGEAASMPNRCTANATHARSGERAVVERGGERPGQHPRPDRGCRRG